MKELVNSTEIVLHDQIKKSAKSACFVNYWYNSIKIFQKKKAYLSN